MTSQKVIPFRKRLTKRRYYYPAKANDGEEISLPDPDDIRSIWHGLFGKRLVIDKMKGMILDGVFISLDELMRKTNEMRVNEGFDQIGRNPNWFV